MTKEQYNLLADYQKEMYDKCNKGNKGALIAGWIFGAIAASSAPSTADQLSELNQMLNSGLITQEELDAKKAEIMSRL